MRITIPHSTYDVVVVGGGPGGCQTALSAASEGLRVLLTEADKIGGQIRHTPRLENTLGWTYGITGPAYVLAMEEQVSRMGGSLLSGQVTGIEENGDLLRVRFLNQGTCSARIVVVATGAKLNRLDVESPDFQYGPHQCYYADVAGKDVAVVGGGNSAGQAIIHLAERAKAVYVILRSNLKTSAYLTQRIQALPNVRLLHNRGVAGYDQGTLLLVDRDTLDRQEIHVNTVVVCTGARPNTDWVPDSIQCDRDGILTGYGQPYATSLRGVYAVGDCRSGNVRRVTVAVGDGAAIQRDIWTYLKGW